MNFNQVLSILVCLKLYPDDIKTCIRILSQNSIYFYFMIGLFDTCVYGFPIRVYNPNGSMAQLECRSGKREVKGWPAVGKNFSFCNSRFLRVPRDSTQPIQMGSTVIYTWPVSCFG